MLSMTCISLLSQLRLNSSGTSGDVAGMYLKHNKGTPGNETVLVKVYFKRESNEFSAKIRMWVHSKIHCPPGYVGLAPKRREKLPVLMSRTNAEIIFEQLYSNLTIDCDMFQHYKFAFATAPLQSTNACPPPFTRHVFCCQTRGAQSVT